MCLWEATGNIGIRNDPINQLFIRVIRTTSTLTALNFLDRIKCTPVRTMDLIHDISMWYLRSKFEEK